MMKENKHADIILIGAGVMSATLGTLFNELVPSAKIKVFEKLDDAAKESSNVWNNAGTGHAGLCELNYTPEKPNGSIDTKKAIDINEQFMISRQFWSYLVDQRKIKQPEDFIRPVPHMSFVTGQKDVSYLEKRYHALKDNPLFKGMKYSDDPQQIAKWIPLMMENRVASEPVAATKIDNGTDINFGSLTKKLLNYLSKQNTDIYYEHEVKDITRKSNLWEVKVKSIKTNEVKTYVSKFVFIGAGGGSLPLLQKTNIPESKHLGGFPVSGLFLACDDPTIAEQHHAKVYGKAKVGAPPMSVPHLDTRYINNRKTLLFGPFGGFSPKFLKNGSNLDLLKSVKPNNVITMLASGTKNLSLVKYLVEQIMLTDKQRLEQLREFIPNAELKDWRVTVAGQRVQVIQDTADGKGILKFGTEIITSSDGTIAALMGASPGASIVVDAMLNVLKRCFPDRIEEWMPKIKEMIPSYGTKLMENEELLTATYENTNHSLNLK